MQIYLSLALFFIYFVAEIQAQTKPTKPKTVVPVIITSASCRPASAAIPQGSLAGGTTLYIQASGLSTTVSKNEVFVGTYPCIVPENGVSGLSIICVTSPAKPDDQSLGSLPIVIKVKGSADSTCTAGVYCYFTYLKSLTSQLNFVSPRVNYPSQWSFFRGRFLVSSLSSAQLQIQFENQICDRSQSSQSDIDANDDIIKCQVPTDGIAGIYPIYITTVNGNQQNSVSVSQQYTTTTETYQSIILPVITGLSTKMLSKKGGMLSIYGLGFGYGTCQVRVYVGGQLQLKNTVVVGNDGSTITVKFFNITIEGKEAYVDGSGLRYKRWWGNTVYQNDFIGEPDVQNVYGTYYNQQFKGFFKAPKTGQYRFYVASDDKATVELNRNPSSIDNTKLELIAENYLSGYRNYWQSEFSSTPVNSISDYINLEEGQYYQIQINHTNGAGPGYLTVSVEIEDETFTEYSVGALYSIQTTYDPIKEEVEYKVFNSVEDTKLSGQYQLVFASSTANPAFSYTTGWLSTLATADQVAQAINALGVYSVTATSTKVDSVGEDLIDQTSTTFAGFRYVITFQRYRTVQVKPTFVFNITSNANSAIGKSSAILVTPSTPIEGTFQLSYFDYESVEQYLKFGTSVDLPFDLSASALADAIQTTTGYRPLVWTEGTPLDGYTWKVQMKGVQELTNFRVVTNNLISGNGEVKVTITTLSQASSNILYEPIPNELLFTYSKTPTVSITLDGLLSACAQEGACNLDAPVDLKLTMTDFTYDEATTLALHISTEGSTTLGNSLDDTLSTITFGDYDCYDIAMVKTDDYEYDFTCTVDGTEFEYGQYFPVFHYEEYGNADVDPNVLPYQAPLIITHITPTSGSEDGGTVVTIFGKGFPKEITSELTVNLGGIQTVIKSTSSNQVVIKTPTYDQSMPDSIIILHFKDGQAQNPDFTYDHTTHISITRVQETILTPIYKGFNTIIGTGFGSIISDITVELVNAEKTYECPVVSVKDDEIVVYLRGGLPGEYRFIVNRAGVGEATAAGDANKFQYNTVITSIENASGSDAGGTRIKINGFNFVPQETIVFIGDEINWICDLDEDASSSTELYCVTPPKHYRYTTPQQVIVTTRILFDSICQGNCEFTYDSTQTLACGAPSDSTASEGSRLLSEDQLGLPDYQKYILQKREHPEPKRIKPSSGISHYQSYETSSRRDLSFWNDYIFDKIKNYTVDQVENIQCITTSSQTVTIVFNDKYSVTGSISETGQLVYTVPDLPQGEYKTRILTSTGYATGMWITNVELQITAISTTTIVQGGQDIEIEGSGFGDDNEIEVYIGTWKCLRLKKTGHRKLKCRTPRITTNAGYGVKILYRDIRKNLQAKSSCQFSTNLTVTNIGQPAITQINNNAGIVYVSGKSAYTYNASTETLTFNILGTNLGATTLNVRLEKDGLDDIVGTIVSNNATLIQVSFANVPLGQFDIVVQCDDKVAIWTTWQYQKIIFQNPVLSGSLPKASCKGGKHLEIHGHGFHESHNVKVCGKKCDLINVNYHSILCRVPDFNPAWAKKVQKGLQSKNYKLDHEEFRVTSDVTDKSVVKRFYDESETTYHISNSATNCWVQIDFGKNRKMKLEHLSFLPRIDVGASYLKGAKFQYSTDGVTFKDWFTIDDDVHKGWNVERPTKCENSKQKNSHGGRDEDDEPEHHNKNIDLDGIRAIKFIDPRGASGSRCQIADIDFRGWLENDSDNETSSSCDTEIFVDDDSMGVINSSVTYDTSATPVIINVLPKDIPPHTQTVITITGTGFISGSTSVFIDDIECQIQSVTATEIKCLSGLKDVTTASVTNKFKVVVDGDEAVNNAQVIYGQRWSDIQTWGGYVFPSDGDSVMVYQGATLIVDVHTPKLVQVLVEGNLVFADDADTSLDAQYLVINRGTFQIGTQAVPHQHNVKITIRGEERGIQYPNMGNKMIGCNQCKIDIHGKDRTPSWTLLSQTTTNDGTVTVDEPVNWLVGDEIIITSSNQAQSEAEVRKIVSISIDKRTLTLNETLNYIHETVSEHFDGVEFPRKVEVGCLTRSIRIQGDQMNYHGVHIYIQGTQNEGTEARIENVEIVNGGQQRYLNRFPINFNNNGVVSNSYIRSNSIHNSNARCIGLQSVSHLEVTDNICYNIVGHAIYIQNGNEMYNTFEHNLVAVVKSSWQLYQSDATAAAFWITNPKNTFFNNRVGGAEWYGFYLAFKSNPSGVASTSDVCPTGVPLLNFTNNAAHSTGRIGLRIGTLIPKVAPCVSHRNDALDDPFSANPSVQTKLSGFITWANAQVGVLADNLGNVLIENVLIASSKIAGYQQHKANFSAEGTTIRNFVIVGSQTNTGLIVPRTNGFLADTVRFANFPGTSTLIESCSACNNYLVWVTGGKNTHFKGIKIINSASARIIHWNNFRREIFWDLDGTLTNIPTGAQIVAYKLHLDGLNGCTYQNTVQWDNSLICDSQQTKLRDVVFNYPTPYDSHVNQALRIYRVPSLNAPLPLELTKYQYEQYVGIWSGDIAYSHASQFALGQTYNINWYNNWLSLSIMSSQYMSSQEPGLVFRFNYTVQRETFDVYRNRNHKFLSNYSQVSEIPNPNTCNNGDWFNDRTTSFFYICISGKQRIQQDSVALYGIFCRETCPAYTDDVLVKIQKKWSDVSIWPNGRLPIAGENVTISYEYIIIIDIELPEFDTILILGELWFDNGRAVTTIKARKIFVRNGKLVAGSITQVYTGIINIILTGTSSDYELLIDNNIEAGNNVLAVTGGLELYGKVPSSKVARLTATASAGSSSITVTDTTDWQVGDWIVISPTGANPDEAEKVQISQIVGTTVIFSVSLKYNHNGISTSTLVDTRATVLHLTRNIRISGATWGARVLVYSFTERTRLRRGYVQLQGVEFINVGQVNKEFAGLDFQSAVGGDPAPSSDIIGCSFHDSDGYLFKVEDSEYVNAVHNVFYNGQKALVQFINSKYIKFQYNTMVLVQKRVISINSAITGTYNWAVLASFRYASGTKITKNFILVSNNVGIGSTDTGFHIMASHCDDESQAGFFANQCFNTVQACFHLTQSNTKCNVVKQLQAYNSGVGVMASIYTETFKLKDFQIIEADRGVVIKPGSSNNYANVIQVSNGYIGAVFEGLRCSNTVAFQLVSVSSNAYPPVSRSSNNADIINTIQRMDTRVYIDNVQFDGYRLAYDQHPQCSNNAVFRQNIYALDVVGQHYLTNTICQNCEFNALLYSLRNPNYAKLGWYGGCGQMECIGQVNFLIEDQTGSFFGEKGQAIGNNSYFGPSAAYCSRQEQWNGYWCPLFNIGVLNFLSTAPDQNLRLFSPTTLMGSGFKNILNAFAEWNWNGPEPQNSRESKFVGLIQINTTINMTNKGENPTNSDYWLSKRTIAGPNNEWVIIELQFDVPNIVQVSADGKLVQPGLTRINQHMNLMEYTNVCGSNNYFYENRTIHFVVTTGCKVSLSLKNTLMISTRLEITTQEFFGDKFLQYAFALLGGDPYNYFIVGTYKSKNRRFLSNFVDVQWAIIDNADIGTVEAQSSQSNLEQIAANLQSFNPVELGTVISNTAEIQTISSLNFTSTEQPDPSANNSGSPSGSDDPYYGNEPVNQGDEEYIDPTLNDDLLQQNDYVGNSNDDSSEENVFQNQTKKGLKQPQDNSNDNILLISVVCAVGGVVLISLIISGALWNRRQNVLKTRVHQQSNPDILSKPEQIDDDIVQYNI
ncbi:unnamed protein product [Paramecium pentaurelia]|uniref:Fibrocystin-L n=1 Tax=Paramecium pentaurelia TaxID=43138 RepID=A0A8S1Y030_9CILI|nr:unnamed protein product [Paramecium pentaurelia]